MAASSSPAAVVTSPLTYADRVRTLVEQGVGGLDHLVEGGHVGRLRWRRGTGVDGVAIVEGSQTVQVGAEGLFLGGELPRCEARVQRGEIPVGEGDGVGHRLGGVGHGRRLREGRSGGRGCGGGVRHTAVPAA